MPETPPKRRYIIGFDKGSGIWSVLDSRTSTIVHKTGSADDAVRYQRLAEDAWQAAQAEERTLDEARARAAGRHVDANR